MTPTTTRRWVWRCSAITSTCSMATPSWLWRPITRARPPPTSTGSTRRASPTSTGSGRSATVSRLTPPSNHVVGRAFLELSVSVAEHPDQLQPCGGQPALDLFRPDERDLRVLESATRVHNFDVCPVDAQITHPEPGVGARGKPVGIGQLERQPSLRRQVPHRARE